MGVDFSTLQLQEEPSKLSFKEKLDMYQDKTNQILDDLLKTYLPNKNSNNNNSSKKEVKGMSLVELLDPEKCNEYATYLSGQLQKDFKVFELEQFGDEKIYLKLKNTSNNSNKNELEKEKKKKVCDTIANHFIKKFNLIAALLFSVKPNENFCLNRLQRLYKTVNKELKHGEINICNDVSNTPISILEESGFKYFLNLYFFHQVQDVSTDAEARHAVRQYEKLVEDITFLLEDNKEVSDIRLLQIEEPQKLNTDESEDLGTDFYNEKL